MRVNKAEVVIACDIDGTLVKRVDPHLYSIEHRLDITNPYDNKTYTYIAHKENIELLRMYKGRGFWIKVWSANGYGHAEAVVHALKLGDGPGGDKTVDEIETKPMKHMDDRTDIDAVVGPRVFIPRPGWTEK